MMNLPAPRAPIKTSNMGYVGISMILLDQNHMVLSNMIFGIFSEPNFL